MTQEKRDPLFPKGFEKTEDLKKQYAEETLKKPAKKDELSPLKKLNHKIGVYLSPKTTKISDDEQKRKIGIIITTLILITLVITSYYFLIYQPQQENLSLMKTTKLNELHDLYSGPLVTSPNAATLESKINDARSTGELESVNILAPASKDWKSYQIKSINSNMDKYKRIMAVYSNESKDIMMNEDEAIKIVNENDAHVLSKIKFETPNTVSVPILISRLQAGAGLINVGSVVDVYLNSNYTNETNEGNSTPNISGCTVLSIMRYEENGEIDSEYSKSKVNVKGNDTYPRENTKSFSSNVLELLKGSIIKGYSEEETVEMLRDYGIKLSNYERQINLGDLDAQYMLLIETPQDKVNFVLNNMENIVLTIPTSKAPKWMVDEIQYTYNN
ncbi:hypothetical protein [uncultured Methanobrevibacter sp.]|uniref:hypothetical protein n=1 Tax=uncultured Methanobrevibacter sp. TaxID=253161 RepID=UPI0025DA72A9|nr:hypothetical protein [uncultured Methanobrevibacter sp.]